MGGGRTQNCEAAAIQQCNSTSACELGTSTQNPNTTGCPSGLQATEKTNKQIALRQQFSLLMPECLCNENFKSHQMVHREKGTADCSLALGG